MVNYDINALKDAIRRSQDNIRTFELAIANERNTIKEFKIYIELEKEKQRNPQKVHIEVVVGDQVDDEDG